MAQRLKKTLPFQISADQSAYVDGRFISEGGRLISDLLEVSDTLKLDGLLATIDIKKAFDSVDHSFLIFALERSGFGNRFLKWVKMLLKNQESCIINRGKNTKYFKLEKGTRQGVPISAYLFSLVLEIAFLSIKENKKIKGLNIFNHTFLYTAYTDDTTFFLKDKESLIEVMKVFDIFSVFSGLKPNKFKCEVAGIGALKGAKMALRGMKCIDLRLNTLKILGIHISYNTKIENDENFLKQITSTEKVRKLTISKIVHLTLITNIPTSTIKELNKVQKEFIWKNKNPKIKRTTLCNNYDNGGLKNADISSKIISLQCSWIKKLYDNTAHSWQVIPLHLIKTKPWN